MDNFNTFPEKEFVLKPGVSHEATMYNRIASINRVNYLVNKVLPEFDLHTKSKDYLLCLDMEMWKRFYCTESGDKQIDEEFCQRMAKVCVEMESGQPTLDQEEFDRMFQSANKMNNKIVDEALKSPEKTSFAKKIINWLNRWE